MEISVLLHATRSPLKNLYLSFEINFVTTNTMVHISCRQSIDPEKKFIINTQINFYGPTFS